MCDPATIGVALSAYGTYSQGAAASSQADYAAKVADQNASLAVQQANDVQEQKAQQQRQLQEQSKAVRGKQLAGMAANGVDSSSGSGLSILTDTAYTTQEDENQLEWNAAKQQWGYKQQAENYKAEAEANRVAGKNAMTSAYLGMAGQLASLGSTDSSWNKKAGKAGGFKLDTGKVFKSTDFNPQYGINSFRKWGG